MVSKPKVTSLEDIEESLSHSDDSIPTEEDVLREHLKKEAQNSSSDTTFMDVKPKGVKKASDLRKGIYDDHTGGTKSDYQDEKEEENDGSDEVEEEEIEEEKEEELDTAPADQDEEEDLKEEDPLDAGEDDPDYEEELEVQEESTAPTAEKEEEIALEEEESVETVTVTSSSPEEKPDTEHTLDDLAAEETSDQGQEVKQQPASLSSFASRAPFTSNIEPVSGYDAPEVDQGESELPSREQQQSQYQPEPEGVNIPNLRSRAQNSNFSEQMNGQQNFESQRNPFPQRYYDRPKKSSKWHLIVLALIAIGVIGASVYLLKNQFGGFGGSQESSPSPTAQTTQESSPSPEPSPSPIAREDFKIKVLNGTATSGLAKTVSDKLKELGYQTDPPGNAPKQDQKTTIIRVKSSATGLGDQLIQDLSPDYTASVSGTLPDSSTLDAEITLGED